SPGVAATRGPVPGAPPPRGVAVVDRGKRIGDRPERAVLDVDEGRRASRGLAVARNDERNDVTEGRRPAARRDEDRPVVMDEPDPELTRNVGRGQHADNTVHRFGARRVDPYDI